MTETQSLPSLSSLSPPSGSALRSLSESELVARVRSGESAAFEEIVRRLYPRVYAIAFAHLRDGDAAEDLAQEVFLRAWLNLSALQKPELLAAWLARTARNLALDWIRRGQRFSRIVSLVPLDEGGCESGEARGMTPRDRLAQQEEEELVRDAVERLPADLREVVLLHYMEGLNRSEIGRTLGTHDSSIGRRLRRAHDLLRGELDSLLSRSLRPMATGRQGAARSLALVGTLALMDQSAKAAVVAAAAKPVGSGGLFMLGSKFLSTLFSGGVPVAKGQFLAVLAAGVLVIASGGMVATFRDDTAGSEAVQESASSAVAEVKETTASVSSGAPVGGGVGPESVSSVMVALDEQVALSGSVLDENDRPVTGTAVMCVSGTTSPTLVQTLTDTAGVFSFQNLTSGPVVLQVNSGAHVPLTFRATAPDEGVVLRLHSRGAGVSGHVFRTGTGEAIPASEVSLIPARDRTLPGEFQKPFTLTADGVGSFQFERLPAGRYQIRASRGSALGLMPSWDPGQYQLNLEEGETTDGLELFLYPGHTIQGRAYDRITSNPLEGVNVLLGPPGGQMKRAETATDGHYRINHIFADSSGIELSAARSGYTACLAGISSASDINVPLRPDRLILTRDLPMMRSVTVSGRVLDERQQPVTGARVSVYIHETTDYKSRFVLSDENGRYELEVAPWNNIRICAVVADYPAAWSDTLALDEVARDGVDLVLSRGARLRGTVVTPDGKPAAGATVNAVVQLNLHFNMNGDSMGSTSWHDEVGPVVTGAHGEYEILLPTSDNVRVVARKNGYGASQALATRFSPGEQRNDVQLRLGESGLLSGNVELDEGKPLEGARVMIYSPELLRNSEEAITDGLGRFRFEDLPETNCTFAVTHASCGYRGELGSWPVNRDDVRLVISGRSFTLKGQVVEKGSGRPLPEVRIHATRPVDMESGNSGRFTVHGLSAANPGELKIEANGIGGGTFWIEHPKPDMDTVVQTFELSRPGSLSGRVINKQSGQPLANARITVRTEDSLHYVASINPVAAAVTNADGRFHAAGLKAENMAVTISRDNSGVSVQRKVEISSGQESDLGTIEIGSGAVLNGRAIRMPGETALPGVQVELTQGGIIIGRASTDAQGEFLFESLNSGNYHVSFAESGVSVGAKIEEDGTHEVVLRLGGASLRGRVVRSGEPCPALLQFLSYGEGAQGREVSTGSDGTFEVPDLLPATWIVKVSAVQGSGVLEERLVLTEGETADVEYVLPVRRLVGRAVDSNGTPVANALVSTRSHAGKDHNVEEARSLHDGTFSLTGVEPGLYGVKAESAESGEVGYEDRVAVSEDGDSAQITLRLSPVHGTLRCSVYNMATGQPMESVFCMIDGYATGSDQFSTGKDGVVTVPRIPPGKYRVWLIASGHTKAEHEVEIRAGHTTEISDVLSPAGNIWWTVTDEEGVPLKGVTVKAEPLDPNSVQMARTGMSDASGRVILTGLLPGSYQITATAEGRHNLIETVTVTREESVQHKSVLRLKQGT